LRLELERFRFPLVKRKPKQKIFHLLLKDKVNCEARESALGQKNGGQKKIKNVMKKFLFWFAVAKRRQAGTHLIILGSVQKKLEFQPKGTANLQFQHFGERLPRRVAPRQARSARQSPILQGFATLRVANRCKISPFSLAHRRGDRTTGA